MDGPWERLRTRTRRWLQPGTTRRDLVTTAMYLLLLSPAMFISALRRDLSGPMVGGLLLLAALPLLVRSRWPLGSVIASAAMTVFAIADMGVSSIPPVAFAITLYSFAKRSDRRATVRVGVTAAVTITTLALLLRPGPETLGENLGLIAWIGLAVAIGDASRSRRELISSAVERAERAERTKEDEARRRVTEERMRIARELHDVVAHHITLVNAQAGVAHHLMKTDPSHAYQALERIRDTSRSALDELRATVGLLRASDEASAPREPTPGLGDLATLVGTFRHAGLEVLVLENIPAQTPTFPPLTELTAYRIVQEALTNTHKHAGRHAVAWVRVEVEPAAVRISVDDDGGRGSARTGMGTGHGMIGMQERVKAVGGTFAAGPRPGGGYRVQAELPLRTTGGRKAGAEQAEGQAAGSAGSAGLGHGGVGGQRAAGSAELGGAGSGGRRSADPISAGSGDRSTDLDDAPGSADTPDFGVVPVAIEVVVARP